MLIFNHTNIPFYSTVKAFWCGVDFCYANREKKKGEKRTGEERSGQEKRGEEKKGENGTVRIETKRECMIRIVIRKNEMNRGVKRRKERSKEEEKKKREERE